jgi:hypothetical protein
MKTMMFRIEAYFVLAHETKLSLCWMICERFQMRIIKSLLVSRSICFKALTEGY